MSDNLKTLLIVTAVAVGAAIVGKITSSAAAKAKAELDEEQNIAAARAMAQK